MAILACILLYSCKSEKNPELIVYEFYPSFMSPIHYTINIASKTLLQESKLYNSEKYIRGSNKLINQEYKIDDSTLQSFLHATNSIKLDSSINHVRHVLDGIGYRYTEINNRNDSISLTSTSPTRNEKYQLDYAVLDAFFELTDKTITNYNGQVLTENIQDYFDYGLPIKLTSKEPLEYRITGTISGCREDNEKFVFFLDSLPDKDLIIFDNRNGGFAPCLHTLLLEHQEKKNIYFYGNRKLTQISMEIDVLQEQLSEAEKNNSNGAVGNIKKNLKYALQSKLQIIKIQDSTSRGFRTREELLETIVGTPFYK